MLGIVTVPFYFLKNVFFGSLLSKLLLMGGLALLGWKITSWYKDYNRESKITKGFEIAAKDPVRKEKAKEAKAQGDIKEFIKIIQDIGTNN